MGLLLVIIIGVALGIALFRGVAGRLDHTRARPKRVFFWAWTPQEKIDRVMREKSEELQRKRYGIVNKDGI